MQSGCVQRGTAVEVKIFKKEMSGVCRAFLNHQAVEFRSFAKMDVSKVSCCSRIAGIGGTDFFNQERFRKRLQLDHVLVKYNRT